MELPAITCARCQTPISADLRFCSECGAPAPSTDDSVTRTLLLEKAGEPEPGSLLAGKFRVLQVLGRGGIGIFYKAEDTKLHRTVALKFLPRYLVDVESSRERFLLEAHAAAALSHPNICTVHEIYDQEDRPFIEMEFVEGRTLREKINEGPIAPADAAEIALQVACALEGAHGRGIVHRDIKKQQHHGNGIRKRSPGPSEGDGLRTREAAGGVAPHAGVSDAGHGGLHVAGAGPGAGC